MANCVCEVLVTENPLTAASDGGSYNDADPIAGAIVDFWGVVRQLEDGREIEGIDYEANRPMAEHQMRSIAESAAEKFGLKQVALHHRIGFVGAGEASLFLRVATSRRGAAFDASKWIVDELKKKVPIWKKPRFKTPSHIRKIETVTAK